MNRKLRIRIWKKIAQVEGAAPAPSAPAAPSAPSAPGAPAVPTTATPSSPLPPPPALTASEAYPSIRTGWDAARIVIIDSLGSKLNLAAHIITNGEYNLQILRDKSFNFDPSSFPSPDQKNIMLFFKKVYQLLLNSGRPFNKPLTTGQIVQLVNQLGQSPELRNLAQVNPTGTLAQKLGGNLQDMIRNDLTRLGSVAPVRTT